jgi:hypothetical protein
LGWAKDVLKDCVRALSVHGPEGVIGIAFLLIYIIGVAAGAPSLPLLGGLIAVGAVVYILREQSQRHRHEDATRLLNTKAEIAAKRRKAMKSSLPPGNRNQAEDE